MTSSPQSRRVASRLGVAAVAMLALAGAIAGPLGGPLAGAAPQKPGSDPATLDPPDPYYPALGNRGYDVGHYDLTIAYDPETGELRGDAKITATATQRLRRYNLDLAGFDVPSVQVDGKPAKFEHSDEELQVVAKRPIAKGREFTTRVRYEGVPVPGSIPGIGAENGWLTTNDGATTLSEPDGARRWFPGNDHPTDKASFAFHLDVPNPLTAVANGELVDKVANGDRTTWSWDATAPMTTYLAQVTIGDLELVDEAPVDGVKIRNALSPRVAARAGAAAAATPEMLQFLSSWFGKYPFSTYGIMVPDGGPQGLAFEAQTFSLIASDLFSDPQIASVILAHELAHQWFGDSVSPADWSETWLNEGFATYGEWLWEDHAVGVPLAAEVERAYNAVRRSPNVAADDPGIEGMFGTAPYERGGLTLHALRLEVGDPVFAQILQTYAAEYAGTTATTEDFVQVVNEVAGKDLTAFLDSWLGPGPLPQLPETAAPLGSDAPVALTVAARSAQPTSVLASALGV